MLEYKTIHPDEAYPEDFKEDPVCAWIEHEYYAYGASMYNIYVFFYNTCYKLGCRRNVVKDE